MTVPKIEGARGRNAPTVLQEGGTVRKIALKVLKTQKKTEENSDQGAPKIAGV